MDFIKDILREITLNERERLLVAFFVLNEGPCYLTYQELSKHLGIAHRSMVRSMLRLISMGVIKRSKSENAGLGYSLTPVNNWKLKRNANK